MDRIVIWYHGGSLDMEGLWWRHGLLQEGYRSG